MTIDINYLGMISDMTGIRKEQIQLNESTTLHDFKKIVEEKHVKLDGFMYKVAMNDVLINDDTRIERNSELVLLPPYAGG